MKLYLQIELHAFICASFEKLFIGKLFIFQWQAEKDLVSNFPGPGFSPISPWHCRIINIYTSVNKKIKTLSK